MVDLKQEGVSRRPGEVHFSERLRAEILQTLAEGDQVILLRNRRGYAPMLLCRACGEDFRCPDYGLPRTYHRRAKRLLCHYCGSMLPAPQLCPVCGEEMFHQRADDAPPYFTMVIVCHVIVGGVLVLEQAYAPPTWVHLVLWLPLTVLMSLWLLPRVKGSLVGLQWALRMHGFGGEPDKLDTFDHPAR